MPCVTQLIVVDEADGMLRLFPDKLFAISCTQSIADRKILVSQCCDCLKLSALQLILLAVINETLIHVEEYIWMWVFFLGKNK